MADEILLFGNGVSAQCAYKYFATRSEYNFKGFCVDDSYIHSSRQLFGLPLMSFSEATHEFVERAKIVICVGYQNMNKERAKITKRCVNSGWKVGNLIPKELRPFLSEYGKGNILMPGVNVQPFVTLGDGNIAWPGSVIGHHTSIGSFDWFSANAAVGGNCKIGDFSFFGMNSVVSNGVTVDSENFLDASTHIKKCTANGSVFLGTSSLAAPMNSKSFSKLTKLGR